MEKTALVTGAGRGIGKAISQTLLQNGYTTVTVSRSENELQELSEFGNNIPFRADLTHAQDRLNLYEFCQNQSITPTVLVNNAGAYLSDTIFDYPGHLEANMDINLIQVRELTALFWPAMCRIKKGHIFNIISILGKKIRTEAASYTMAKHALSAYNALLFEEGKKNGIKVTGLFPASVYTSAWEGSGVNPVDLIVPNDIAIVIQSCLQLSQAAIPKEIHIDCMTPGF